MAESELHRLVDEVANQNIWIILDLCYEQLIYDPVPHNLVGSSRTACVTTQSSQGRRRSRTP